MNRLPLLLLASTLLSACAGGGGGVPDCLVFTPVHATSDGVVDVETTIQGDVVEAAIDVETAAIESAPASGVIVELQTNCDDADCTPEFDCAPGTLDPVGTSVVCDVIDEIAGPTCNWTCQLSLTATVLDDTCRDVFVVVDVAGAHEAPVPGR
ncbi:MAG: hypothetical protein KDA24_10515 [Deltaproteobacteria bacterium]|nr:hypothetical protein [Deltaproteobacteria bacterium]